MCWFIRIQLISALIKKVSPHLHPHLKKLFDYLLSCLIWNTKWCDVSCCPPSKGPPEARWCTGTDVSFWPSAIVCSLISPGNSTGPHSEGEQRYQMDIGRGVKERWNGQKNGGTERQNMHTRPCTSITRVWKPWKNGRPTHPRPCANPVKFL